MVARFKNGARARAGEPIRSLRSGNPKCVATHGIPLPRSDGWRPPRAPRGPRRLPAARARPHALPPSILRRAAPAAPESRALSASRLHTRRVLAGSRARSSGRCSRTAQTTVSRTACGISWARSRPRPPRSPASRSAPAWASNGLLSTSSWLPVTWTLAPRAPASPSGSRRAPACACPCSNLAAGPPGPTGSRAPPLCWPPWATAPCVPKPCGPGHQPLRPHAGLCSAHPTPNGTRPPKRRKSPPSRAPSWGGRRRGGCCRVTACAACRQVPRLWRRARARAG